MDFVKILMGYQSNLNQKIKFLIRELLAQKFIFLAWSSFDSKNKSHPILLFGIFICFI